MELAEKLEGLPKDLAVALLCLGVVGVAIPGPIPPGASFVLLGTVILKPGILVRLGGRFARLSPKMFLILISLVDHFRVDLEKRYPGSVRH
jgi:uncharacterized protein YqgC (DUF456 family)